MTTQQQVSVLKPPPRRSVTVTIDDYAGGTFTLRASAGNGWDSSESLVKYLEQAFSGWCRKQQDARWAKYEERMKAEIAALPWWRRMLRKVSK